MEDFQQYLRLINNCDQTDPLLSDTTLGEQLNKIPLSSVNRSDLNYLTQVLNPHQLIPTESGLARDYRGLAERMGFSSIEIENCIKRSYNPTRSLIDGFVKGNKNVTLNDLLKLIEDIERFDVIDDIMPTLVKLAAATNEPENRLSIRDANHGTPIDNHKNESKSLILPQTTTIKEFNRLTVDDTPHSVAIIYDAFICFAPEDMDYAKELIDLLEAHDKSVATADDLLPGHFEHDALVRLIDTRCRKVIIILTPNFSRSRECEFQQKFASEIGIKADSPKIIPVFYEHCEDSMLPSMIKVLSKIDMTNQASREWQLHRLIRSLSVDDYETHVLSSSRTNSFSRGSTQFNRIGSKNNERRNITAIKPDNHNQIGQFDGSVPAITLTMESNSSACGSGSDYHNKSSVSPIIDIIQSESSGELELRRSNQDQAKMNSRHSIQSLSGANHSAAVTTNSNNPINWLKKQVTKRVWRNESGVSTSTSQSVLLNSDYADGGENYQQVNGGP